MLNPGQILDVRYEVVNRIEEDSHGSVYVGNHVTLNKQIAIKEIMGHNLAPDVRHNITPVFIEKTRVFAKLDHVSLPKIMDFFPSGDHFYIIMDYIKGENVENFMKIRHSAPLEEKEAIKYIMDLCKVMWFLHNQKPVPLFMGNLNPASVIIGYDGKISLVSFGINKYINQTNYTRAGFAAPEAYRNKTTPLSDIFSLGNILYYMITGLNPGISRHTNYDLPSVRNINPDISVTLEKIVKKAIDTEPFARFDNMKDMKQALQECLDCPEFYVKERKGDKRNQEGRVFESSNLMMPGSFKKEMGDVLDGFKDTRKLDSEITQELPRSDDEPVYEISSRNLDQDPMEKVARERQKKAEKIKEKQRRAYEAVEETYKAKEYEQRREFAKFIVPVTIIVLLIICIIIYVITRS
ncbi:MAG: serine/threonine-protein kinase [Candidatus Eremiobacterota bacterium]